MPEMTPERIASLAQTAKDRDPNPEPLNAKAPDREPVPMRASAITLGGREVVIEGDDLTGAYDEEGGYAIYSCGELVGLLGRGQWSSCVFEEVAGDEPDAAAASQPGRVLTDADVQAIAKALSPGYSGKIRPEGGLR